MFFFFLSYIEMKRPCFKSVLWQQQSAVFGTGTDFVEDNFPTDEGGGRWFWDDSSVLHLLCTLFLLLLPQLHLRSWGIRSWSLETPDR